MPEARLRVGVMASGKGSNLQAILEAIDSGKLSAAVAVVISNKEGSGALERARGAGIPAIFLDPKNFDDRETYDTEAARILTEQRVGLVVLAGYMRLVGKALFEPFRDRMINIHPSLLPAFAGLHAQKQALEWGAKVSGCTVHLVDETLDQGAIIIQAAVPVLEGDTPETLQSRIQKEEHQILPQAIRFFAEGRVKREGRGVSLGRSPDARV